MNKKETPKKAKKIKGSSVPIVDSLATALSLLNYFSVKEPELSLQQLSERSGLYKSRIHRLCATLVLSGFLVRMPWATYRLGPKLMALGKIYEATNSLITISRPIMRALADETGESVALFALEGETCYCLAREFGSSRLVFSIQEGDRMELHASAAGRVLMAHSPAEFCDELLENGSLEQFTPLTMTNPRKIKSELASIRKRGYAVNKGERELEIAAIAAPIFGHDGQVNASLAIVGPEQRFAEERMDRLVEALLKSTRRISELMGGAHPL